MPSPLLTGRLRSQRFPTADYERAWVGLAMFSWWPTFSAKAKWRSVMSAGSSVGKKYLTESGVVKEAILQLNQVADRSQDCALLCDTMPLRGRGATRNAVDTSSSTLLGRPTVFGHDVTTAFELSWLRPVLFQAVIAGREAR
jgi:hypothetical protein